MASRTLLPRLRPMCAFSSPKPLPLCRKFHSHDHPPPPGPYNETESLILSHALPHIPSHGFTSTSLALGAKDAGYIDASVNLFPKGAVTLVGYYLWTKRMGLSARTKAVFEAGEAGRGGGGGGELGVREKVKLLTWERLSANKEVIHRWQEALSLLAQPTAIPLALRELHALSDEILYLSNSTAVDTTWYTQRLSLSSIYASSELFMTTDKSSGFGETRKFMESRFSDAEVMRDTIGSVGQWVGFTAGAAVNILRSKGVRI